MRNDLNRVYEHPRWQHWASGNNGENKNQCCNWDPPKTIFNLVHSLFLIFANLSEKRPVKSRAEKYFFALDTFEIFDAPESYWKGVKLVVVRNFPWIHEI